jgi:hypothetical protein
MKISKILFFSLLGTIALVIVAGAMDLRINGTKNLRGYEDKILYRKKIDPFKALSICNASNVTLIRNDSSFIEIHCMKDSLSKDTIPQIGNYSIKDDTLKMADFISPKGKRIHINVKVNYTGTLNSIQLKNSWINLKNLNSGKMSIEMDSSTVRAYDQSMVSNLQSLDVFGKNKSSLQIRSEKFNIDSLNIVLQNSDAYMWSKGKRMKCDISNKSNITLTGQPLEIIMKKDTTSHFSVR